MSQWQRRVAHQSAYRLRSGANPWMPGRAEGVRRCLEWFRGDPARKTLDEEANRLWDRIISTYEGVFPLRGGQS